MYVPMQRGDESELQAVKVMCLKSRCDKVGQSRYRGEEAVGQVVAADTV